MNGISEWAASLGAIAAAALIAFDISRKVTGWGFVLFCLVSILWVLTGIRNNAVPLVAQNMALLAINAWGVWRYLLKQKRGKQQPKGDGDQRHGSIVTQERHRARN